MYLVPRDEILYGYKVLSEWFEDIEDALFWITPAGICELI